MDPNERTMRWRQAIKAAVEEDLDTIRLLVEMARFDVNRRDERGRTLLHYATEAEIEHAWELRKGRAHVDCTAYLLLAGADPTIRDEDGQSACDIAAESGHWLAEWLLFRWPGREKSGSHEARGTTP